ncbi:MAG TPA: zinc-ribbon domain containing protein [Oscillospiraceae bacterium]|nr:zinc-ribbon domain containing protein [Oscillospiraceae bacterium]
MIKRKCSQCGKEFFLSDSEIDFYNKKNLTLPKRCKECRNANKQSNSDTYSGGQADTEPKNIIISKGIGALIIFAVLAVFILIIGTSQNLKLNEIFFSESSYSDTISSSDTQSIDKAVKFTFRNEQALNEHYQKHGIAMGFSSAQEYEEAAGNVVTSSDSLHKTEKEDGDDIYYNESTNEFVIISTDGYIRTYFYPDDGKEYFDRQ